MKLSTRGRYGVAIVQDLAQHYGEGAVSLKSIGERQEISDGYLHQLVGALHKAGYIKSLRGSQGGFSLTRDPAQITVGEIVRVMEGPIAPVDCLLGEAGDGTYCPRSGSCRRRPVWARLRDYMNKALDSVTFADICRPGGLEDEAVAAGNSPAAEREPETELNNKGGCRSGYN